jgi:transcriptional regulator GlxA family with amidase domain
VITVVVALFDAVEELDFAGPWEVVSARTWPGEEVSVFTVADSSEPVTCAKGFRVLPERTWQSVDAVDVLVYPGGRGVMSQLGDERIGARLRRLAERGTSVCTSALMYADAGLLDGRAATTHWSALEDLEELGRNIDVRPDARFVDSGEVITAAGVSAGIDVALHLVARLHSEERACEVWRNIQYDPERPV